ncbi:hypothetical protein GCM10010519_75660 [Streptomyces lactacystinicus]
MRTPFPTGAGSRTVERNLGRGCGAVGAPAGYDGSADALLTTRLQGRDALHLNWNSCTGGWGPLVYSRGNRGSYRASNDRCMPRIGRFITETVCRTVRQLCYPVTNS